MKKTLEFEQECDSCGGTGVYRGMAERDGYGVVCTRCEGTGHYTYKYSYREFDGRKKADDVQWVIRFNPGICVGPGKRGEYPPSFWGAISYKDFESGKGFPPKSEMRQSVCPAWWYQGVDYKKKPEWDECGYGAFSACKNFGSKDKCWERWDKEFGTKK